MMSLLHRNTAPKNLVRGWGLAFCLAVLLLLAAMPAKGQNTLFTEEFKTLDAWKPLTFKKIKRHTAYSVVQLDQRPVLKIQSDNSASGLVHQRQFDITQYPLVQWRWRVENILENGDATQKSGDDYALRLYVLFAYDASAVGFFQKAQYEAAKLIYGAYPPLATLNYIWANKAHSRRILPNPFTSKAMMVIMDAGPQHAGEWRTHQINILADYQAAFGHAPRQTRAAIAIMGDADNTGGSATAYIDYIRVFNAP